MKILFIFGTRPEAIKMASLYLYLKKNTKFDLEICVTGQHKEMLDQVLKFFKLKPDYSLSLMEKNQTLAKFASKSLEKIQEVVNNSKPDLILVHGDTTTTLTATLAGYYSNVDVGHVEAGLRTNNIDSPFPEEMNRQVVSRIAKHHFAPTNTSKANLISEGIKSSNIIVTGNTVIDSLRLALHYFKSEPSLEAKIKESLNKKLAFDFKKEPYLLITGHRRESFGKGFINICNGISELAKKYESFKFIYPVHLNPNVLEPVNKILKNKKNIILTEPVDYAEFIMLLNNAYLVLTDSGGIQEEAPSLGKPVLVMRDSTERPEAIDAGTVKLVGSDSKKIFDGVSSLLDNKELYKKMSRSVNPYGDGRASERIKKYVEKL
tara:strand:- start:5847 stop:6977 length:1131 start_codon:yes stop_codon:yes gene_type:complete